MKRNLIIAAALSAALSAQAYDTPTMGWSSWNTYRVNISDSLIMRQADALVELGLDKLGYRHINIDDGYFGGRDEATGRLLIHPGRFPNGLKPVVDHIHSLGLKAGIYSDAGANTCGNYWDNDTIARNVGLMGHERADCEFFFRDMGFDFIKVDFCGADTWQNNQHYYLEPRERYAEIAAAIAATGRDDVRLNVCRWNYPGTWVSDMAASWRISGDINPSWKAVKGIIAQSLYLAPYAVGGKFNDMDMLELGRGLSPEEETTHMAMWCMMSSPLLIGCDLTGLGGSTLELLKNEDLIAIDQDSLARQAYVTRANTDGTYILVKDIMEANGTTRALALYNPTDSAVDMAIDFADIELGGNIALRDLIARRDLDSVTGSFSVSVPAHGTRVYRATGDKRLMRRRYEGEQAFLSSYQELYDPLKTGTAFYTPRDGASGGMTAANLGNRPVNDCLWRDVIVPGAGEYNIMLRVYSPDKTRFVVYVNGDAGKVLETEGSGWETLTLGVRMNGGANVVRLASPDTMPEIDYMEICR